MKRKPRETKRERKGREAFIRATEAAIRRDRILTRVAREIQCGPIRSGELGIDHLRRNVDHEPGWQT